MIIYRETISQFIRECNNADMLASKLQVALRDNKGIGVGPKEVDSWKRTLIKMKDILSQLDKQDEQYVLLEYVIRDLRKRIDIIIIGKDNKGRKNLAIIELKGWSEVKLYDKDISLLKPNVSYGACNHPSYEAYDYYWILQNQYSDIANNFNIVPMSYLPNYKYDDTNILQDKRFEDVISKASSYCQNNKQLFVDFLRNYFQDKIDIESTNILNDLDYKPSVTFLESLQKDFENVRLIGSQQEAFETFKYYIDTYQTIDNKKKLFIVSGCAGSGKTVVAFKMLLHLLRNSKNTNLMLPGPEFRDAIVKTFGESYTKNFIKGAGYNNSSDIVIIDEAHKATGRDNANIFYSRLMKNVKEALICLIDDSQVINRKGITKDELKDIANEYNYEIIELNLQEQFRNGGDISYIDFLRNVIFHEDNKQETFINDLYDFRVFDEKEFNQKYLDMYDTKDVRMASFWTQTWDLDNLTPTVKVGSSYYIWNPNWQWYDKYKNRGNKTTKELDKLCNKTNFNLEKKGKQYIAYFNTVQGYEFDYIFVHVPRLFYLDENNIVRVDLSKLYNREMSSQYWSTSKEKNPDVKAKKDKLNQLYFLNRLFVLLTRGRIGTYVYIEDERLNEYIKSKLRNIRGN